MAEEKANHNGDGESYSTPKPIPHWRMVLYQGITTPAIENHAYKGRGTDEDPYVVEWLDDDPRNPFNWSNPYKWMVVFAMAFATLAVSLCSSMFSEGIMGMVAQFGTSDEVGTLGLSLFVLGFALGPLIWAPLSELYGRQVLFAISFAGFTIFNGGVVASQNMQTVIILRFFAGSFGSSPLTNAGGVIADMFHARQRGVAMSIFAAAPFLGPALGPVIGGFMAETVGFRWILGVMAIFSAIVWVIGMLLTPETYAPVLLRRRAQTLSKQTGKSYQSKLDLDRGTVSIQEAFKTSLSRPWILLFKEPIVLILSTYMAIIYGTLYMLFAAYPIVYQQTRGWSSGIGGLAFIGVLIGMILAISYSIFIENPRYQKVVEKEGGMAPPEARLPAAIVGGIMLPIGLFWFSWSNAPSLPWEASVAAGIPFGFGMVLVFLAIMNYLIDAYTIFAASALAANSVLRSCFGAAFPLFTTYMYRSLGIHWASSIPAFLALACVPFPFLFYKYGGRIRQKCKYAAESEAFMKKLASQGQDDSSDNDNDNDSNTEKTGSDDEKSIERNEGRRESRARWRPEDEALEMYEAREDDWAKDERPVIPNSRFQAIRTPAASRPRRAGSQGSRYDVYNESPFDLDRVNTRDSFKRQRSSSRPGTGVRSRSARGVGVEQEGTFVNT